MQDESASEASKSSGRKRRKKTVSVRRYRVSRDGSMSLVSSTDSLAQHKQSQQSLVTLTNFAQINQVLDQQTARNLETDRLRTERRLLRRANFTDGKRVEDNGVKSSNNVGDLQSMKSPMTRRSLRRSYISYFRIDEE